MNLTNKDYQKIVKYYNIRKPANKTHKQVGEEILANKLCKCIKSVGITNNSESRAIAICRNSIFNNKNLGMYNFECKQKYRLLPKKDTRNRTKKGTRKRLYKTARHLNFKKSKTTRKKTN
jgi:hypothetical protein